MAKREYVEANKRWLEEKAINHQYLVKKVKKKNAASSHPREADCISLLSN